MSTSLQNLPYFGRRYEVRITGGQSDLIVASSDFEPEALRVRFDCKQIGFKSRWFGDIEIYNLDQATTDMFLGQQVQNLQVSVSAGYQNGAYGVVWVGDIFQPIFDRHDSINYRIVLRCTVGLHELLRNSINKTFLANIEQLDLIKQLADQSFTNIPLATNGLSPNISAKKLPRAKTMFGSPHRHLTQLAEDNNMQWWLSHLGLNVAHVNDSDIPTTPSTVFSQPVVPSGTGTHITDSTAGILIGTPQQTQYGVSFRALLNPAVQVMRPMQLIQIKNTQIQQQALEFGSGAVNLLDQDGLYVVAGVRFLGDSRGNEWYVDIDGFTRSVAKTQLLQFFTANQSPSLNK